MRQVKSRSAIVHLRTAVSPFWARRIGIANRRASEPYVREHKGEHANRMKPSGEIGEADKLILINLYNTKIPTYTYTHPHKKCGLLRRSAPRIVPGIAIPHNLKRYRHRHQFFRVCQACITIAGFRPKSRAQTGVACTEPVVCIYCFISHYIAHRR